MEDAFEKNTPSAVPPLLISYEDLSEDALNGIIESFILREGTDYGVQEVEFSKKFSQVLNKIKNKEFIITFDAESESVTLLTQKQWNQISKGKNHGL